MNQSKSTGTQNKQSANETEEDVRAAAKRDKSSKDAKTNVKSGTGKGAGGGAKQKQGR